MHRVLLLVAVFALVGLIGCGVRVKTEPNRYNPYSIPHRNPVCLLSGGVYEKFEYIEIGRIVATKRTYGSVDELYPAMADEARRVGADAVVNLQADIRFKGPLPWRVTSPTGDGTAIKFKNEQLEFNCSQNGGRIY